MKKKRKRRKKRKRTRITTSTCGMKMETGYHTEDQQIENT